MRRAIPLLVLALVSPLGAHADDLAFSTLEHGDWPTSIAALETDGVDGTTLQVVVKDGDTVVTCGRYTLQLDAVGAAALTIGACDPDTDATLVTLTNRHALFAHDDVVARPLAVGITAVEMRTGGSRGGASTQSGSTEHCTIEVHPYLVDPETHAHVPLRAPRYALRVSSARAEATPTADGWSLRSSDTGSLEIPYDVLDTTTDRVVTTEQAELMCGGGPARPAPYAIPDLEPYAATSGITPSAVTNEEADAASERSLQALGEAARSAHSEASPSHVWISVAYALHYVTHDLFSVSSFRMPHPGEVFAFDGSVLASIKAKALFYLLPSLYVGVEGEYGMGAFVGATSGSEYASISNIAGLVGVRVSATRDLFVLGEVAGGLRVAWVDNNANFSPIVDLRVGLEWRASARLSFGLMCGCDLSGDDFDFDGFMSFGV